MRFKSPPKKESVTTETKTFHPSLSLILIKNIKISKDPSALL
jgi:hypothetical protein